MINLSSDKNSSATYFAAYNSPPPFPCKSKIKSFIPAFFKVLIAEFTSSCVVLEKLVNFIYRSEEHTSELQSRPHLVCRLLLEKKKKKNSNTFSHIHHIL